MLSRSSNSTASSRSTSPSTVLDSEGSYEIPIMDIGGSRLSETVRAELRQTFLAKPQRTRDVRMLPASVFHDEKGLRIWANITNLPDYYQTRDEIGLLEQNGEDLTKHLAHVWTLIDLGCGDVKKIIPLLDAFEKKRQSIQYFALDLSREVLVDSVYQLGQRYDYVHCHGLWGTFDDCLDWAKTIEHPKCYISLGSMLGNDHFDAAVHKLRQWTDIMTSQDRMLLGLDATQDRRTIWKSYHDEAGHFKSFIRNGLVHSNRILGHDWYKHQDWEISGKIKAHPTRHHFVIRAVNTVVCRELNLSFRPGQVIHCYEGLKFEPAAMQKQFTAAGLKQTKLWKSPAGSIYEYLLCRAPAPSNT